MRDKEQSRSPMADWEMFQREQTNQKKSLEVRHKSTHQKGLHHAT